MPRRIPRKLKKLKKKQYIHLVDIVATHGARVTRKDPQFTFPNWARRARNRALRGVHFVWSGPSGSVTLYIGSPRWAK